MDTQFATTPAKNEIGVLYSDGVYRPAYSLGIDGQWYKMDGYEILINGLRIPREWQPITREAAQALVDGKAS